MAERDLFGVLRRTGRDATPARHQFSFLESGCLTIFPSTGRHGCPPIQVKSWIAEACKTMNLDTNDLLTAEIAGRRWAEALRRRWPDGTAKVISARLRGDGVEADFRTVQSWLGGQAPRLHVALAVALALRDPLLLFELAGLPVPEAARVDRQLEEMRADLDALGARIGRLKGGGGA